MGKFHQWDRRKRKGMLAQAEPPVAIRWVASFDDFLADVGHCPAGHGIKAYDRSKPLGPSNWQWSPSRPRVGGKQPALISWQGSDLSARQWAEKLGVAEHYLRYRLSQGATIGQIQEQLPKATRTAAA